MKTADEHVFEIGEEVWRVTGNRISGKAVVTGRVEFSPGRWLYAINNGPLRRRESGLKKIYKAA